MTESCYTGPNIELKIAYMVKRHAWEGNNNTQKQVFHALIIRLHTSLSPLFSLITPFLKPQKNDIQAWHLKLSIFLGKLF